MENGNLRHRQKAAQETKHGDTAEKTEHPGGVIKHGGGKQMFRLLQIVVFFNLSCFTIVVTQFIGLPLYWINRDIYYAYMALTKQSFGIFATALTQWFSPTVVRISGDASVAGQLRKTADGRVECQFPDRMVMIANHQLYSDWLYLWWIAYANSPSMHGHIYIILKDTLRYVPIIGWGMMFYGFIFMSRKMSTDRPRLAHRLKQLKEVHSGPMSGTSGLDPMWLLIFPEGTNASDNGRKKSAQWAEKTGIKDLKHTLLPRSTGSFFILNELKGSVDYVYDCTMAYEGVPRCEFGQDLFSLRSMYLQGRPPWSVNMYWRRFAVKDIPLENSEKFDLWLRQRWEEKDAFMEEYLNTGRFPGSASAINATTPSTVLKENEYIETEVKLAHWSEIFKMASMLAAIALVANLGAKAWNLAVHGRQH